MSRERTPALKPSKRDLREDFSDDFEVRRKINKINVCVFKLVYYKSQFMTD